MRWDIQNLSDRKFCRALLENGWPGFWSLGWEVGLLWEHSASIVRFYKKEVKEGFSDLFVRFLLL